MVVGNTARMPTPVEATPAFAPELIRQAAAGDRQAQGAFVRAYQDRVYRLLLKSTGERELALDLAQETFLKAFGALDRFRLGSDPAPWLFQIAHRLFLDHLRRVRPASLDAYQDEGAWAEPGGLDMNIERIGTGDDLNAALARLPEPWREALVLRHFQDQPYEAIAEILGVPIGTVKTWLHRGRDRLRQELEGSAL